MKTHKTDCEYLKYARNDCILPLMVITVFQYLIVLYNYIHELPPHFTKISHSITYHLWQKPSYYVMLQSIDSYD